MINSGGLIVTPAKNMRDVSSPGLIYRFSSPLGLHGIQLRSGQASTTDLKS